MYVHKVLYSLIQMYSYQPSIFFLKLFPYKSSRRQRKSAQLALSAISMLIFPSIAEKSENAFVKKNIFNHRLFKFHIK